MFFSPDLLQESYIYGMESERDARIPKIQECNRKHLRTFPAPEAIGERPEELKWITGPLDVLLGC